MSSPNSEIVASVVIPAYNEEKRLPKAIEDIKSFFTKLKFPIEFIIVVEKSTDNTVEVARKTVGDDKRFKIIANDVQRGKGFAVKTGFAHADGQYIFFTDADLSTPLSEIINFILEFQSNPDVDILIGDRRHQQSEILRRQALPRQNMGRIFNLMARKISGLDYKDTQCGFKAFKKEAGKELFSQLKTDHFAFDVEILMRAKKAGYNIKSMKIKWVNDEDSKVNMVKDSLKMLRDLIKMRKMIS